MINLSLSEEQYKYLFTLLDRELRSGGLGVLTQVVSLHNALVQAALPPAEVPKVSEKPETDSSEPD